jgi:IS30 family transposase
MKLIRAKRKFIKMSEVRRAHQLHKNGLTVRAVADKIGRAFSTTHRMIHLGQRATARLRAEARAVK